MDLSTRQSFAGVRGLDVSYNGFLGAVWAGVAVSFIALSGRLYSRFRGPGRIFWDDVFTIFAFILVLITGALWQWAAKDMYYVIDAEAGLAMIEADFMDRVKRWLMVSLIVELFFYTSLLLIKISFLLFFWRLGAAAYYFKFVWWPVLFVCIAWYAGSVGNVNYKCLVGPAEEIIGSCNEPDMINWTDMTLKVNCALDVFSDFLLLVLPTILLWNIRIRWEKKVAVFGLFWLSIVTMVIAIVRTASIGLTKRPDGQDDVSYLWLWSSIEPAVAIVVSCGSAFPQLFRGSRHTEKPAFTPTESYLRMMSRIRSGRKQQGSGYADLETNNSEQKSIDNSSATDIESASHRSQDQGDRQPSLVPNAYKPVVHTYGGVYPDRFTGRDNETAQDHELNVRATKQ